MNSHGLLDIKSEISKIKPFEFVHENDYMCLIYVMGYTQSTNTCVEETNVFKEENAKLINSLIGIVGSSSLQYVSPNEKRHIFRMLGIENIYAAVAEALFHDKKIKAWECITVNDIHEAIKKAKEKILLSRHDIILNESTETKEITND